MIAVAHESVPIIRLPEFTATIHRSDFAILSSIMARVYPLRRKATLALRQRRHAILGALALPSQAIRASVVERFGRCGKANCLSPG
jgi:hypothetical protein